MKKKRFISLRTKLRVMIALVQMLFLVLATAGATLMMYRILLDNISSSVRYEQEMAKKVLESTVEIYRNGATMIQNSEQIREILRTSPGDQKHQLQAFRTLEDARNRVSFPLSLYRISIFCDEGYFFTQNSPIYLPETELENYPAFRKISPMEPVVWIGPEKISDGTMKGQTEVVSFLKAIGNNNSPDGYQKVSIQKRELTSLLSFSKTYGSSNMLYFPQEGQYLCREEDGFVCTEVFRFLEDADTAAENALWHSCRIGGRNCCLCSDSVEGTNWRIVTIFPKGIVFRYAGRFLLLLFLAIVLLQAGSWALITQTVNRIVNRIYVLEKTMNKPEPELAEPLSYRYPDEIDRLYHDYNRMTLRMREMFQKQLQAEKEKRVLELSAMQAQINPHFLYNTLDLLHWKAIDLHDEDAAQITEALVAFYRLTLGGGKEIVPLADELQHIEQYVRIQNYRFDGIVTLSVEVPEEMDSLLLPKLTLQPLIENSIQHGFLPKKERSGSIIEIYAWFEGEAAVIQISDNGIGMPQEEVSRILTDSVTEEEHGYGVKNIDERLRINYGEQYGLTYESREAMGTTVYIRIPKTTENNFAPAG